MEQIIVGQWYLLAGGEHVRVDALDDEAGLVSVTTSEGKALELLMTALDGARQATSEAPPQSVDDAAYWSRVADLLDETEWQGAGKATDFDPLDEVAEEDPLLDDELTFDDETPEAPLTEAFDNDPFDAEEIDLDEVDLDEVGTRHEPPVLEGLESSPGPGMRPEPPKRAEPQVQPERWATPPDEAPVEQPLDLDPPSAVTPPPATPAAEPPRERAEPTAGASLDARLPLWLGAIAVLMVLGSSVYQQMQTEMLDSRLTELSQTRAVQPPPRAVPDGLSDEVVASVRLLSEGIEGLGERISRLRAEVANDGSQRAILQARVSELEIQIEGLRAVHNKMSGELRTHLDQPDAVRVEATAPVERVAPVESAPAAPTPAAADPGKYAVVLLSLPTRERADKALAEFGSKGLPIVRREATVDGKQWQRLLVEGFATREEAAAYITRLANEHGIGGAWVMRR